MVTSGTSGMLLSLLRIWSSTTHLPSRAVHVTLTLALSCAHTVSSKTLTTHLRANAIDPSQMLSTVYLPAPIHIFYKQFYASIGAGPTSSSGSQAIVMLFKTYFYHTSTLQHDRKPLPTL